MTRGDIEIQYLKNGVMDFPRSPMVNKKTFGEITPFKSETKTLLKVGFYFLAEGTFLVCLTVTVFFS